MGSSPSTATLVGDEAVSGCSSGAELAAWDRDGVGASPTSQTKLSGRNSAAEYVALNHVGAGASPAARTATDRSSAAEQVAFTHQRAGASPADRISGCSSGGERLLGMQEAAGAIPVIQTQIDSRRDSFTATAPRWNAELLTPAVEVRVLSVVRLATVLGWNATLRTLQAGVQLLSVALRFCHQFVGAAAC